MNIVISYFNLTDDLIKELCELTKDCKKQHNESSLVIFNAPKELIENLIFLDINFKHL